MYRLINCTGSSSLHLKGQGGGARSVRVHGRHGTGSRLVFRPFASAEQQPSSSSSSSTVTSPSTSPQSEAALQASTSPQGPTDTESIQALAASVKKQQQQQKRTKVDSTDAVATFLTRRFGLAGGFAWLAILAVGSLGEQVKTRLEVAAEEAGTRDVEAAQEVVLPSGVRYTDLRVGGGQLPIKGYLMVVDFTLKVDGQVVDDTRARGKPIVFRFGTRPYSGGMCRGAEEVLSTMKAGSRRRVVVPAALGFGESGAILRPTEHVPGKQGIIPPNAELEYDLELVRVSIPPS